MSMDLGTVSSYINLRFRVDGDVARTVVVRPGALMVDVDEDGIAIGIEKIGDPLSLDDVFSLLGVARFPT